MCWCDRSSEATCDVTNSSISVAGIRTGRAIRFEMSWDSDRQHPSTLGRRIPPPHLWGSKGLRLTKLDQRILSCGYSAILFTASNQKDCRASTEREQGV